MSRNFVERQLGRKSGLGERAKKSGAAGGGEIYDDTDVCRALRVKRRILVAERKRSKRGTSWDCVGHHAGMTGRWILSRRPDAKLPEPIREDGIVTVEATMRVPNFGRIMCRRVSDGAAAVVSVKDSRLVHIGDQMDAEMRGSHLTALAALNPEAY